MKHLTLAEYTALIKARDERDELRRAFTETPVEALAHELVAEAERRGVVVTIEQVPLQPFAMGHYRSVVSTRPARPKA